MRIAIIMLTCALLPGWVQAQALLPRNEAVMAIGWSGSDYQVDTYDRWEGSMFVGAGIARYWTPHLKTDIEAAWTSPAASETYEDLTLGGVSTFARAHRRSRDVRLAVGQSFQFGRNAWAHPYLGAGADIVWRRSVLDRPAQQAYPYGVPARGQPSVQIPALRTSTSELIGVPFVKTGVKMYASERMFFVTELKLGFAPDLDHALWKLGMGMDF